MIQITPQMRILVAIEAVDGRKGIDSLAQLCQEKLLLFMSLLYTCELSGANPFDYLTQLQRHAGDLVRNPSGWMPWNYPATLESSSTRLDSG